MLLGPECGSQAEGSSVAEGMLELQRGHNPNHYSTSLNDSGAFQSPAELHTPGLIYGPRDLLKALHRLSPLTLRITTC